MNDVPQRPAHGCITPGCPALVRDGARCPDHARALAREIDSTRASASRRGYGTIWRATRLAHLRRNPLCVTCHAEGRTAPATDVDHILARRRGGTDDPSNLQSFCHYHHSRKTALEDGRFGPRPRRASR